MTDESGVDAKVIAVPIGKLTSLYDEIEEATQLPKLLRDQIIHFFEHYKDLEPGKWVKVEGWENAEVAKKEIRQSVERYNNATDKPAF
jgi:inorganic pyrophosphatase